ncbi:MAG: hypothetical protein Q9219_003118 [cf. Caloplaca sp. 3 TL-2023]
MSSTEALTPSRVLSLENNHLEPYIGQEAHKGSKFCPLAAVSKWPYRFFQHEDSEIISKAFFAAGKFRMRGWTLYYIHTLLDASDKPLILVPATEVQTLFDDIKRELRLLVYFPKVEQAPGFLLSFEEDGIPLPRYLGRLDLEHNLDEMEAKIPPFQREINGKNRLDDRSFAAFKKKMDEAVQATKNKSKAQKNHKKRERIISKENWCEQLKRAQCYLGLRPRVDPGMKDPVSDPSIPFRELERALKRYKLSQCIELPNLHTFECAPFPFYNNVVLVCIDVEAYEKNERPVTEIGISTLDTNDLVDLPPGRIGEVWMKKIRSRHFRIKETAHLNNFEFVAGCADRFEPEFGMTEWISIKEAPQTIASCFRPHYCGRSGQADGEISGDGHILTNGEGVSEPKRQLILVGHDVKNDVQYFRKLGYDVSNLSNLIEAIDTADLYRAWKHTQNPSKLGSVLVELELTGWNLHNAGNDAAYTLQALIGIAISARQSESTRHTNVSSYITDRAETLEREARDRAKEEADEWEAADREGGDGGAPKPLERFGWPTDEPVPSYKTRKREQRATFSEVNETDKEWEVKVTAKECKAKHPSSPEEKKGEDVEAKEKIETKEKVEANGKVKAQEEADEGTVSQSMSERLAMLDDEDANGGGVKLPRMKDKGTW